MKNMKFKIPTIIFLSLFIYCSGALAQTTGFGVEIKVQRDEKEVKVSIKNNMGIADYKYTAAIADTIGTKDTKSGTFDRIGEQLVVSFTGLEVKKKYSVLITGTPVVAGSGNTITKTYTLETNFAKPNIVETGGTTQTPGTVPDPVPLPPVTNPDPKPAPFSNSGVSNIPSPQIKGLTEAQIKADKKGAGGLVPCIDTCDFNDVLRLINNLITFLITTVFIPIIIILFMYAGYKYITAGGNSTKIVNLKKMVGHIIVGMLLVLCSWLIVNTLLTILTSDPNGALQFLK